MAPRTKKRSGGSAPIAMLTDFGYRDHYVGAMKGVIASIAPGARIVDITHGVPAQSILAGAMALAQSWRLFPAQTVFMVVVDPGVGTTRLPVAVQTRTGARFIGPDNGVLSLAARGPRQIHRIASPGFRREPVSPTFHGRDVFAPTAAWVSKTFQTESFGEVITDNVRFAMPKPKAAGPAIKGVVLRVDIFGNLITNLTADDIPAAIVASGVIKLSVNGKEVKAITQAFASGAPGEPVALMGSAGFLEIAVNRGSAARTLGANRGAEVTLDLA